MHVHITATFHFITDIFKHLEVHGKEMKDIMYSVEQNDKLQHNKIITLTHVKISLLSLSGGYFSILNQKKKVKLGNEVRG